VSLLILVLPQPLRRQIVEEARAAYPREGCGLIEGMRDGAEIRVTAIHPVANLAEEPDRFELDPARHIALLRGLRGTGREIVGCYHSHPNACAEPSARDRAGAFEDGFLWLIEAVDGAGNCDVRAYLAEHGEFHPLEIVEPDSTQMSYIKRPSPPRSRGRGIG
jgi:proteasome lid subunit RPN8/RPN11